jgi:hypothetical protein
MEIEKYKSADLFTGYGWEVELMHKISILKTWKTPTGTHKFWIKELNSRRRVYVEIPKPARVELKCSQNQMR